MPLPSHMTRTSLPPRACVRSLENTNKARLFCRLFKKSKKMKFCATCKSYEDLQLNSCSKFTFVPQIFTRSRKLKRLPFATAALNLPKQRTWKSSNNSASWKKRWVERPALKEIYQRNKNKLQKNLKMASRVQLGRKFCITSQSQSLPLSKLIGDLCKH